LALAQQGFLKPATKRNIQEFVMTVSSRLVAFVAAAAVTAVTFAGPSFAAPTPAAHQAAIWSAIR